MPRMMRDMEMRWIQSPELHKLIDRVNKLTDGEGYELYDENTEVLQRILEKMLVISKRENEWYCYFMTMCDLLYLLKRSTEYKKILQYAEVLYKERKLHLDETVEQYGDEYVGLCGSVWSYAMIFECYAEFPQIDDKKIMEFMELYKEDAFSYGDSGKKDYYAALSQIGLMYRDVDLARAGAEGALQCEIKSCYLCAMKPVLGYYLLLEDYESFESLLHEIRTRNIPAKYLWSYNQCSIAKEKNLIGMMLRYCLRFGRMEYFDKLLQENKNLYQIVDDKLEPDDILFHACVGDWSHVEEDCKRAEETDKDRQKLHLTPLDSIYECLMWTCYFTLLKEHGVKEIAIHLTGERAPAGIHGKCDTSEVAHYFEKIADKFGIQMEHAREKFDYEFLKVQHQKLIERYTK